MAKQVGAKPGATDSVIALGALRMMHDIAARCAETGINTVAPSYGYHIVGFTECLQDPSVREATDACLVEIAQESEILQYVKSPDPFGNCLGRGARYVRAKNSRTTKKRVLL
jgi:hypothetical protein